MSDYRRVREEEQICLDYPYRRDEYIMVGKDVKITFLGGVKNQAHIMIDAPKEINIARGRAIEKRESNMKNL
ncbi:MAG TPA: hypothetical protein DFK11_04045 [Lachnospiraceae bacterium]|nr:hypothetical protein [Lachnospiraceae bacterium]